jgi:predicted dehydrogenase
LPRTTVLFTFPLMNTLSSTPAGRSPSRREFLKQTTLALGAIAASPATLRAAEANSRLRIAVIGLNGRGLNHLTTYQSLPNTEIAALCDVDSRALAKAVEAASRKQPTAPKAVKDLRQILDDPGIDAVSIATPDHWHAPATIMACAAGKHVYVEKPGSHNGAEARLMVQAARRHKRVVQMGNQRRSWPWVIQSIEALESGEIGKVLFARAWYTNKRGSIGRGKAVPVPDWLDYTLWQGPAPDRAYQDNIIHYNWHWFWNWGTGELGNNGVHALDLARWGLQVDLPSSVTCAGHRYFYEDDWETPDTAVATFHFENPGRMIIWEGQSSAPRGFEGVGFGVSFFGEKGSLVIGGSETKIYDLNNKELRTIDGKQKDLFGYDGAHFGNFLDGIRQGAGLRAEIEEGQKATLLCHLGNIAWRTGQTVRFDPQTLKIRDNKAAQALWTREYRRGWEPRV